MKIRDVWCDLEMFGDLKVDCGADFGADFVAVIVLGE